MKAKLKLRGKEYEVEIGDEVVERIESKVWEPESGERVYWLSSGGDISPVLIFNNFASELEMGMLFPTTKQAGKYRRWLKWIKEVRQWNVENKNTEISNDEYYFLCMDSDTLVLSPQSSHRMYPALGVFAFKTHTLAWKFIEDFSQEKIVDMMKLQQEVMEMA